MNDDFYNIAFERAVLSSVLFQPQYFDKVSTLKPDDFYLPSHKNVYIAMSSLIEDDKPIDEEFIKKALIDKNCFDEQTMLEIMSANPISNLEAYVDEVKNKSTKRQIINLGIEMQKLVGNDIDKEINAIENALKDISSRRYSNRGINFVPITEVEKTETDFILKDWLPMPKGTISLITAPGGSGKSWTALQVAMKFSIESPQSKSALWLSEDSPGQSRSRAEMIAKDILNRDFSTFSNLSLSDDLSTPPSLIKNKQFSYDDFYALKSILNGYELIILDPLIAFYGGEENDNSQARIFMQPFMNWAREENICIVFLHHSTKATGNGSRARGAGAFVDAARTVYEIDRVYRSKGGEIEPSQAHLREFKLTKDNYGCISLLKDFTVKRHVTPKSSAQAIETVYETTYSDSFSAEII